MKKDDYMTEFEEQRKEIKLDGETDDGKIVSRVDLHRKNRKPKKRSRYSLINILLVVFTLIPIGILAFVIISWNSPNENIASEMEESQFQFEKSKKPEEGNLKAADHDNESVEEEKTREQKEAEERAKEEEKEKARAEAQAKEEREKEAARQQAEQEKKRQEQQRAQAEKEAKENQPAGGHQNEAKTHIVAPGETLYRISVNYYKSGDGVSKIMQANGLSTNDIHVGQKLIIP